MTEAARTHGMTMRAVPALSARAEWREGGRTLTEATRLLSVDLRGATIELSRPATPGQLIHLLLSAPGSGPQTCADVNMWALVWGTARVPTAATPLYTVSLIFCGTDIPRSFAENPEEGYAYVVEEDERFRVQSRPAGKAGEAGGAERRRESRIHLPVEVVTELLDEAGEVAAREIAITENISRGGAAVRTMLLAEAGSRVRLTCEQYSLTINCVVRRNTTGPDLIPRMHLEFLDGHWPI